MASSSAFGKTNNAIQVFCTCTHISLLPTTEYEWLDLYIIIDIQKSPRLSDHEIYARPLR